jgi:hypothetical protein
MLGRLAYSTERAAFVLKGFALEENAEKEALNSDSESEST